MSATAETLSCGIVLVREVDDDVVTLLLRAYHNWDFPKGVTEDGEEPLQTACREVTEETSIAELEFHWVERFMDTGPYNKGKVARYFLAGTTQSEVVLGISPELGRPEHNEFRWVSFDEAHDLTAPRVREVVRWARQIVGA